jgi:hypothetical protein
MLSQTDDLKREKKIGHKQHDVHTSRASERVCQCDGRWLLLPSVGSSLKGRPLSDVASVSRGHVLTEVTTTVTTGPLERSSCRIHLRGRCRDEGTDVASTPAAGGCADWLPSQEVYVSNKSIVFLPSSLLRSRSLFWLRERRGKTNAQV